MKNLFKKLLPALIVTLVLTAALAVTALATDYSWVGEVTLLDMSQDGVAKTNYSDIDGNSEWIQVAHNTSSKALAYEDANFYWGFNHYAYYNSTTKTFVVIPAATGSLMSGRAGISAGDTKICMGQQTVPDTETNTERYTTNGGVNYYYVHGIAAWLAENGANVEHLEFRPYITSAGVNSTAAIITQDFGTYVASGLANIKTVKLTTNFTFRCGSNAANSYNTTFQNKASLTTVQYGDFAQSGAFTTDCPVNAVTLKEGNKAAATNYGVSSLIFSGCSSIERVIIEENTMGYVGLKTNAFANCTSLKFVYITTAMSDSYLVGTTPFSGCSDVNVYVDDTDAATALAAFTNITLKEHADYEDDLQEYFSKNAPIYADGVLVKIADNETTGENVAIRFIFRWDAANTPAMGTPVKVGVVACSAAYYDGIGGTLEAEKLVALLADTDTAKVKKNDIAVYEDGKMSLVGKFLADGTDASNGIYSYAYTLYGIPSDNYDSEIYAATYIQWSDGTYSVASNTYTDYEENTKNTISLYDVTLGLFKRGLINSEYVEDKYLWDVIQNYKALSHAMTSEVNGGKNVTYLYFPDNILGGYVLVYKATTKYADDGKTLAGAVIPHNGNYWGAPAKLEASMTYFYQTHTTVVDYGVTGVGGARIFGGPYSTTTFNETIKTIVYPNGFSLGAGETNEATHAFNMLAYVQDVIWCHTDSNGNYVEHMSGITWSDNCVQKNQLIDLRGFGTTVDASAVGAFTWDTTSAYYPSEKMNIIVSSDCTVSAAVGTRKIIWKAS